MVIAEGKVDVWILHTIWQFFHFLVSNVGYKQCAMPNEGMNNPKPQENEAQRPMRRCEERMQNKRSRRKRSLEK